MKTKFAPRDWFLAQVFTYPYQAFQNQKYSKYGRAKWINGCKRHLLRCFSFYHFTVRWSVILLPIVLTFKTLYCPADFICLFRTELRRNSNFPSSGNISVFVMVSWNIQKNKIISKFEFLLIIILYVKARSFFFSIDLILRFSPSKYFVFLLSRT
jgi:hypothetical protein